MLSETPSQVTLPEAGSCRMLVSPFLIIVNILEINACIVHLAYKMITVISSQKKIGLNHSIIR